MDKTKLPPVEIYTQYINIASIRFSISVNQVRDKYGLYTIEQWEQLFNTNV